MSTKNIQYIIQYLISILLPKYFPLEANGTLAAVAGFNIWNPTSPAMVAGAGKLLGAMMDDEIKKKVIDAIANQGSSENNSPSGPILIVLRELAGQEKFAEMSEAFQMHRKAHPANQHFVSQRVVAMISNVLGSEFGTAVVDLDSKHPEWSEELVGALTNPGQFAGTVKALKAELQKIADEQKAKVQAS